MKNVLMYKYDPHSESAELLQEYMGIKSIRHEGSTFKGDRHHTVVNWGSSDLPRHVRTAGRILNSEGAVHTSANKLRTFRALKLEDVRSVPWTSSAMTAREWLLAGARVVVRARVAGKDGEGVSIIQGPQAAIPEAPLYTKMVDARNEYRFHVVAGNVVAAHRKVQDRAKIERGQNGSGDVKNSKNGWVFKRVTEYDNDLRVQSTAAIRAVGLDFGAVDLIWDGVRAWVLETNTAPAINEMAWTCRQYAAAITAMIPERARG